MADQHPVPRYLVAKLGHDRLDRGHKPCSCISWGSRMTTPSSFGPTTPKPLLSRLKNPLSQVIRMLDCFQHTKLQASALTALFGRTWDLENFDAVLATLPAGVDKQAASRLGWVPFLTVSCLSVVKRHDDRVPLLFASSERRAVDAVAEQGIA